MDNKLKREKKKHRKKLVSSSLEARRKMKRENIYRCAKCLLCLIYAIKSTLSYVRTFVSEIAIDNRNWIHKIVLNILFASQFERKGVRFYWTEKKTAWFKGKLSHNKKNVLGFVYANIRNRGVFETFYMAFFYDFNIFLLSRIDTCNQYFPQ